MSQPPTVIAHLITAHNRGGTETQLTRLVLGSNRGLFRHVVISMTTLGPLASDLRAAGVRVHSLEMRHGIPSLIGLARLVLLLNRSKPCVLHCWLYHSCLLGLIAGGLANVPHVIWGLRSANEKLSEYSLLTRSVVRLCATLSRFPDVIVVNSEKGKAVHKRWGYNASKLIIIPNGIDFDLFSPDLSARLSVRNELGIESSALLVGLFARYHPVKDHSTFLHAARILSSRYSNLHFLLAGPGIVPVNHDLSQMVRENRLSDRVHLLGLREDVPRLMASLDIACLSSWSESSPNVVGEDMSCGVPCVVTDVGDASRMVGSTGLTVPPRNPRALAEGISALIAMTPAERAILGSRARNRVRERFSLQNSVRAYESLYKSLARGSQR